MSSDLIQHLLTKARRLTAFDIAEANLQMFKRMGLDLDDLERMAASVHLAVEDFLFLDTQVSVMPQPCRVIGKPGRAKSTEDIARFAAQRRASKTWREILTEWKELHPEDKRVKHKDSIREAYRRFYGDKTKKRY